MALSIAALALAVLPAFVSTTPSTTVPQAVPSPDPAPVCSYTRQKIRDHRQTVWHLQRKLGMLPTRSSSQHIVGCQYARWVEGLWWRRTVSLRKVLRYRMLPNPRDWGVAINVAQRVYPGTASWLWSCSGAEGGHSYWKWYGSRPWAGYHVGNDFLGMDTVGGWMQFRFSTFESYQGAALAGARAKGFLLPRFVTPLGGPARYAVWLSPIGQALTAGYMRYYGKDGHHWAASWGNGCR